MIPVKLIPIGLKIHFEYNFLHQDTNLVFLNLNFHFLTQKKKSVKTNTPTFYITLNYTER